MNKFEKCLKPTIIFATIPTQIMTFCTLLHVGQNALKINSFVFMHDL